MLPSDVRRKYALGMARLNYGVWGYQHSLFRSVHLTTKEGDDNTVNTFVKDYREFIRRVKRQVKVEYCGALELTPRKGLLHYHGLLRVKGGYLPLTEEELKDEWFMIHGASQSEFEEVESSKALTKYINKHILKGAMASDDSIGRRILMSGSWKRKGVKEVELEFRHWWSNGNVISYMTKDSWLALSNLIKCFCENRGCRVSTAWGWFKLKKGGVTDCDIYGLDELPEGVEMPLIV